MPVQELNFDPRPLSGALADLVTEAAVSDGDADQRHGHLGALADAGGRARVQDGLPDSSGSA